jgi:hypothetical protein
MEGPFRTVTLEMDQELGLGTEVPAKEVLEKGKEFLEKFFPPAEGVMGLDPVMLRTPNLSIRRKPGKRDMKEKWS